MPTQPARQIARQRPDGAANTAQRGALPPPVPARWDGLVAHYVSQAFSPVVLTVAMVLWGAALAQAPGAWAWSGAYLILAIGAPVVYLLRLFRRGQITDLDLFLRAQRVRPLQFTLGAGSLGWLMLAVGGAPALLVVMTGALLALSVINYAVTLRWKISMHTTVAAAATTFTWTMTGHTFPLLVGVPLVAWSRVRLGRHTTAQTIAGGAAGFLVFLGARYLTAC
ncbi:MAG: hypothetical protein GX657_05075 [Chloroflexi bacterium]|jgi:membrane-associated phospholipid phosphatase|nr:hypothetical protein [Chloroflexota bacterium]